MVQVVMPSTPSVRTDAGGGGGGGGVTAVGVGDVAHNSFVNKRGRDRCRSTENSRDTAMLQDLLEIDDPSLCQIHKLRNLRSDAEARTKEI